MRIKREEELFKPVTLVMETQKELLSIRTALQIALISWHKEGNSLIDSHIELVEKALCLLRKEI